MLLISRYNVNMLREEGMDLKEKHSSRFVRPFEPYPDDCVVFRAAFDTFGIPWRFAG